MSAFKTLLYSSGVFVLSAFAGCQQTQLAVNNGAAQEISEKRQIHERAMVLDSHLDTPALLVQPGFDITKRYSPDEDYSQVDLPRMNEGGLDGGFWVIYSPQGPLTETAYQTVRDTALLRALAIHEMVAANPDEFALATKAEDAKKIIAEGKKIVYLSIENSYPLGEDISLLETFYKLGVRMVGPVHFKNNQFGDSGTDIAGQKWNGLSPLGEELVVKANELGMILDASHAHDDVFDDLLRLSKTPIVLSHSGAKAIYDHPRNIDDERLKKLAASGGVIQVNAYGGYIKKLENPEGREEAMSAFYKKMREGGGDLTEAQYQELLAMRREIDAEYPPGMATFDEFLEHLFHILDVVGPDHVGLGADWDGGGGVQGMRDVSDLPLITYALLDAGYTEADIRKIWGENLIDLLVKAEAYKESLKD